MLTKLSDMDKEWIIARIAEGTATIIRETKQNQLSLINQAKIAMTEVVQEELKSLVMVDIVKQEIDKEEYKRTRKIVPTGKKKVDKVNALHETLQYNHGTEGAIRGVQSDLDMYKNRVKVIGDTMNKVVVGMGILGQGMNQMLDNNKTLIELVGKNEIGIPKNVPKLEG